MYKSLIDACFEDENDLAVKLIRYGTDVNMIDENGNTPLIAACSGSNILLAKVLIRKGANVNAVGENDYTPLLWACTFDYSELAILLIKNGTYHRVGKVTDDVSIALTFSIDPRPNLEEYLTCKNNWEKTYYTQVENCLLRQGFEYLF